MKDARSQQKIRKYRQAEERERAFHPREVCFADSPEESRTQTDHQHSARECQLGLPVDGAADPHDQTAGQQKELREASPGSFEGGGEKQN